MRRIKVFGGLVYRGLSDSSKALFVSSWFAQHPPFPQCTELFSIYSGVVADNSINCHEADKVGGKLLENTAGQFFENMKLHRKDRVNTFATMSRSVTIDSEKVTISTQTIFHRMILTQRTDEELAKCLKYELAPYPPSLFDDSGVRKRKNQRCLKNLIFYIRLFPWGTMYAR